MLNRKIILNPEFGNQPKMIKKLSYLVGWNVAFTCLKI